MKNLFKIINLREINPNSRGILLFAILGAIFLPIILILGYNIDPLYYLSIGILGLPLLYFNKNFALYFYVTSYVYTLPIYKFTAPIRIDDFIFVVIASIWFLDKMLNPKIEKSNKIIGRSLIIWLIINALSIIINFTNYGGLQLLQANYLFLRLIEYVLVYFIISDLIKTHEARIIIIRLIWFITIFISLFGLYQYHFEEMLRLTSTLSDNHAHIGTFLPLTFFLLLGYLFMSKNIFEKVLILSSLPLIIYVLILSASRAGILALIFGIIVYLLFSRKFIGYIFAALFLIVIINLGIEFFQNLEQFELGVARFQNLEQELSTLGRLYIWNGTFNMLTENPSLLITGVGLGAFLGGILDPYIPLLPGLASGAHNNYLHHLTETGIAGFLTFMYIMYVLFKVSFKRSNEKIRNDKSLYYGYFCGLAALLISGLTQETISVQPSHHNFLGYFFLVTAVVFKEIKKSKNLNNK